MSFVDSLHICFANIGSANFASMSYIATNSHSARFNYCNAISSVIEMHFLMRYILRHILNEVHNSLFVLR